MREHIEPSHPPGAKFGNKEERGGSPHVQEAGGRHTFREDPAQARTKAKGPPPDTGEWMRTRLGFEADEAQIAVVRSEAKRGILNLHAAMGEVDDRGSEGGPSGVYAGGEFGAGGESVGTAEQ
jgi:hypothetical protein